MISEATLEKGRIFQDYILFDLNKRGISFSNYTSKKFQYKVGENTAGIEIKHDMMFRKTNNLFIEIKTKCRNGSWLKSGIYRNDNTWLFLIGDKLKYWIFGHTHTQIEAPTLHVKFIAHPRGRPEDFNRLTYLVKSSKLN